MATCPASSVEGEGGGGKVGIKRVDWVPLGHEGGYKTAERRG